MPNTRQYAPATQRNKQPILQVLQQVLPDTGTVLEIASGTGEHAVFFAQHFTPRNWIPSDPNPIARASIDAWREEQPADNLCGAIALDVHNPVWPVEYPPDSEEYPKALQAIDLETEPIRAIVNINMIHISPWSACLGLLAGAQRILPPGGVLYLYGPFKQNGEHTANSNAVFDRSLQTQNPAWGVRDLGDVIDVAAQHGFNHHATYTMPANNLSVVFHARSN